MLKKIFSCAVSSSKIFNREQYQILIEAICGGDINMLFGWSGIWEENSDRALKSHTFI